MVKEFYACNDLQKNGHDDISTQGLWNWEGETIYGHDRTEQRKSGSPTRKTVAVIADKNTEKENGDNLGYGSQRINKMDEGLTLVPTTRKRADKVRMKWTKMKTGQEMANRTGIIILKKKRSNTEKAMTPGDETDFLTQVPTVSPCEHRDGWTVTAKMRRSVVESLDENIRDWSETPGRNHEITQQKWENKFYGTTLSRTTVKPIIFLSQSVFLRYPSRTSNPPRNDVFKLDRTGKQVLKLPQSCRNNDIKLDHHHNQKGGTNESIVQWNINGLRNNFEELKILTEELDPTIVCLQETNVKPKQQTIFGGHEVFSKTVHAERAKHGVAILVKEAKKLEKQNKKRTEGWRLWRRKEWRKKQNEM
jgi:hypothetical protein